MKVTHTGHKIIKSWCENIEEGAFKQAFDLSELPFTFSHVALMPDCHQGYGMPIGGVLATEDVIIPNAVGVDIGCGMACIKTNLTVEQVKDVKVNVPVGFKKNSVVNSQAMDNLALEFECSDFIASEKNWSNAGKSLGTLGGGNHFIEFQKDENDVVYIMVHSGSRNLGKQVADRYNKDAIYLNRVWHSNTKKDLAFLPAESSSFCDYLEDMTFCVEYAKMNRRLILAHIVINNDIEELDYLDVAHNYARLENHFGKNVWVHRKGATSARKGELGIIPGSQGTSSYIVEGLGNKDSFMSCSHGAGRKMGRNVARRTLSLEDEIKFLDSLGVQHSIKTIDDLDEAPSAYKDIDEVMEAQKDLVKIVKKLTPIRVIKG